MSTAALRRARQTWNALGQLDPLWAVLSQPDRRGGRWDWQAFLATGEAEIAAVLRRLPGDLRRRRALDFGCGAGRLTHALAQRFEHTDGVDAAPSMLALAADRHRGVPGCTFHCNAGPDLGMFADHSFDLVYSSLTLQHLPPPWATVFGVELVRLVAPGGALVMQLPDRRHTRRPPVLQRATARIRRAWQRRRGEPAIPLYGVPRADVEALIAGGGLQLTEVEDDGRAGTAWSSLRYWARRP